MREPISIVIADADRASASSLGRLLATQPDLRVAGYARGGPEAVALLAAARPQIMVLDITSMREAAVFVMEQLARPGALSRPQTVVLTAFGHEGTTQRCVDLGAEYYLLKPFGDGVIADRIRQLAGDDQPTVGMSTVADRESRAIAVTALLREIGVPAHLKGHGYLREAILAVAERAELLDAVTKELYPQVAARLSSTPTRVERSIRHAIDFAWRTGPSVAATRLLGSGTAAMRMRPTNSALIAAAADWIVIGPALKASG